jgi:hypothetical protein
MENIMTVAELIKILSTLPQDLTVEMGMNEEYQDPVGLVEVVQYDSDRPYVLISESRD